MLTCIVCSKQLNNGSLPARGEDDDPAAATLRSKQPLKGLTAQIKDMALKASGAYRNCKPCSGSSSDAQKLHYADSEASERFRYSYRRAGSSNSTPRLWGKEMEARLKGLSSGDATPASVSGRAESIVFLEEEEPKEWVAQVEPGVLITFVSLPRGGNDLKRLRFSRELFNKWQAQQWWAENYDKVMELYNVQKFNRDGVPCQTPPRSEDEVNTTANPIFNSPTKGTKVESPEDSPILPPIIKECLSCDFDLPTGLGDASSDSLECRSEHPNHYHEAVGGVAPLKVSRISQLKTETSSIDDSVRTSSSREADHSGELSISNASDMEGEWVEQDEPGVYITIRALPGGIRELRRIRFSRDRFGEMHARRWWEENRARINEQYL